tara:strand:- start:1320 stop:1775 length:456 start_codon:yes stop_codon:yes gene_type:complete
MSSLFLNQSVPNKSVNIRVNDAVIDSSVVTQDLQINNYFYEKCIVVNQAISPTTTIDALNNRNLLINTQTFTTPHTTNNFTSFLVTNFDCASGAVIDVNIQKYSGTGLPIVTGIIADDNNYQITIINLHTTTDLDNTFQLSLESKYFVIPN